MHEQLNYIDTIGRKYPGVQVSCAGDPDLYESINWNGATPISQVDLDATRLAYVQKLMWEHIKEERDTRKAAGVQIGDYWFHSDDTSRIQQIGLVMLGANIPTNLQWKTMSGSFVTMTSALAQQIFQTTAGKDTQIFAVCEDHRKAMLASPNPGFYDYSGNWPITFDEYVAQREAQGLPIA